PFRFSQYTVPMLWRVRNSRGKPSNAPAAFIHPCQPIVAKQPPSGPGWAHELKHDGYRLQIHVRDGRMRLYTMNGADWSKRYPALWKQQHASKSARLWMPGLFVSMRGAFQILTPCIAAPPIILLSLVHSIC
ncbi:MAG: hypothetical protein WA796_23815, partial [Pseudolabrys sp.]